LSKPQPCSRLEKNKHPAYYTSFVNTVKNLIHRPINFYNLKLQGPML
jgi:hypothetical protein